MRFQRAFDRSLARLLAARLAARGIADACDVAAEVAGIHPNACDSVEAAGELIAAGVRIDRDSAARQLRRWMSRARCRPGAVVVVQVSFDGRMVEDGTAAVSVVCDAEGEFYRVHQVAPRGQPDR